LLSAWLETHKRYPESARERGEEGHAVLRFQVDRSGRVLDYAVTSSSGYADLDQAVEEMMRGATLPPFPADMPQPRIEVSVTIRFSLRRSELKPERPKPVLRPNAKPEPTRQAAEGEAGAPSKKLAVQPSAPDDVGNQQARNAEARPSSQPRAPLGSQSTASEVDLVRQQIARCWNVPAGARDAKDLVVEVRIAVDPDGTVRQATIVDQARLGTDPFFRAAAESARRAFFSPLCRPLHLPPDKYAIWRDLVVDFSPKDIL
jgi:TonB family protein